ncbi:alpha/beta hydrolase [Botrimarina sp.]|uniref:alpha/beta hydrolase n=1 Tax=Botrimarina sp. TaxID=2795802 RepID=UPI0032EB4924
MTAKFLTLLTLGLTARAALAEVTSQEIRLWDGAASVAGSIEDAVYDGRSEGQRPDRWLHGVTDPVATLYRPDDSNATGAAVVVFPGGGYSGQAIDKEGHFVGRWLAERGVAALVTPYRCGAPQRRHPAPLADAQRAVRLLRDRASDFGIQADRVGVMGFSAGGHLAATTATHDGAPLAGVDDPLASVSARPDFAILVYPVISMRWEVSHGGSRRNLLGDTDDEQLIAGMCADEQVDPQTPPTLLIHSVDDQSVPVANAVRFFEACRRHNVPVEMHLYQTGGHGYGMWANEGSVAQWPTVLEGWLRANGFAKPSP